MCSSDLKEEYEVEYDKIKHLGITPEMVDGKSKVKLYRGAGCELCSNTGYKGRKACYEVMEINDKLRDLVLERADAPYAVGVDPLTVESQRARMDGVLLFVAGAAGRFFRWTRIISRLSNTIEHVPAEIEDEVRADPDTFYAIGYFDLAEDERLEVRVTPPECEYWGLHTTNHWLEPIEHDSIVCHRNHATSEANADGSFTLSISPVEDSHPNSLPTLGHRNGAIFFRVVGATDPNVTLPVCTVRKRNKR